MSRVGKVPVRIPAGVKIDIKDGQINVEGPKGKLQHKIAEGVAVKMDGGNILVGLEAKMPQDERALVGVTRTLIHNMVQGVATGFTRELDIVGVGFKAATKGNTLNLIVGFSHPIEY